MIETFPVYPPGCAATRRSAAALFARGYLLQVTNPKAIAFWLAIAALNVTAGAPWPVIAAFVLSMAAISFSCRTIWAFALSAGPVRSAHQRARRWIEGALGAFLAFAAFTLATTRT